MYYNNRLPFRALHLRQKLEWAPGSLAIHSTKGLGMTAEVAILNRNAVAIAADSAVTVSRRGGDRPVGGQNPEKVPKIYNTANKLFALSNVDPIAVMVYAGAEFAGIPWDTVVKDYRRTALAASFGTVDGYADHFAEHLGRLLERTGVSGVTSTSGVVFAGFGTEQLFPALSYYRITTTGVGAMTVDNRHRVQ